MTHARKLRSPPPASESELTFLTRKEAARDLRISVTTLDRFIADGRLKAKKHGHAVVVMLSEVERYISDLPDLQPRAARYDAGT